MLQAFVKAFHELSNEFTLRINLDRWKGNGYRKALLRQGRYGWLWDG